MAKNRSLEQKKLKMKRRGRYAVLSGAPSRISQSRVVDYLVHEGEDKVTVASKRVYVGPVSFSKQVINTGRGPDAERMQTYYQRLHTYDQAIPQTLGLSGPMKELKANFDRIVSETPSTNKLCLFKHSEIGEVYLFYTLTQYFFVETILKEKKVRRSRIYGSMDRAKREYKNNTITWVEVISSRKVEPA